MVLNRNADISPDGRWLAYQSDESGRFEIYVRPSRTFRAGGGRFREPAEHDPSGPETAVSCTT
jgi:hypothetical protein